MKTTIFFLLVLFSAQFILAQNTNTTQVPKDLNKKDQELLLSFPVLKLPTSYKSKTIPYKVDNSELEYFRDMFVQAGMSCGQASSTGICFTYEMNCARNLAANTNEHLYPTHFVYNWASGDWGGSGVSYYHTLDVLRSVGTPNLEEYGGSIDAGGDYRWMTGYDLYYSTMHNRVSEVYCIPELDTDEGLTVLKHWINDHLNGSEHGGCAIWYSTVPSPDATLDAGTEEGGKTVITELYAGTSHSMAILGYNDSIRYDYNGDGFYTNDIDINSDGMVDMNDWEIGGVKMCNTYSGGPDWADGGFCYIMYKAIAGGALWHDLVHVMYVNDDYEPMLTTKATVTYTNRKRIKIVAGMSTDLSATSPEYILDFPIFNYQSGERYMTGGTEEADKTIEFGFDITPFLNYLEPGQEARFFLQIRENDDEGWGSGQINSFSVIEYTSGSGVETSSMQSDVDIVQNGLTQIWVNKTVNHNPPEITNTELPVGAVLSPYSTSLIAENGTPPYKWSFDMNFEVEEGTASFPTGGSSMSASYNLVNLNFEFPFYGEKYHDIYVGNKGLIVFEPNFSDFLPYNDDDAIVFMHNKSIAPLYNTSITSNVSVISNSNNITLIFDNNKLDYAVTLHDDGRIVYSYQNCNIGISDIYTTGVSSGDLVNFQILNFFDQTNVSDGFQFTLNPHLPPEEFNLSPEGLLTGTPTHEYLAEDFYIQVCDNNNLTNLKVLPFITDGLILQFNAHTADDDLLEYNETVDVDVTVQNPMDAASTNIIATVSSTDPYVSITDNNFSILALNSDEEILISNAFQFIIDPLVPDQHTAYFIVNINCDQGDWNYPCDFELLAPVLEPGEITVSDDNDNLAAAGEDISVSLSVQNNGHADAANINIELETTDPYITLTTSSGEISSLSPTASQSISFDAEIAESVPMLHEAHITMNITADNGYSSSEDFIVVIHTPVIEQTGFLVNDYDNSCLDADETSDILIGLLNSGMIDATNLILTLSTDDEFITINNNTDNIALIEIENTTTGTFNVTAHSDAPMAHLVTFNLNISGDNGLDINLQMNTIIGILMETWESGDILALEWVADGSADWYPVTTNVYEGTYSLRSGEITSNQITNLHIQMFVVEEGDISFAYKVSSEASYDFLEFLVDNIVVESWSGNINWNTFNYTVYPGTHNFTWRYRKDGSIDNFEDCAWIDNIVFPPVNNLPPAFDMSTYSITKNMYPDQTDTETVIIYNLGGGVIDVSTNIEFLEIDSKSIEGSDIICNIQTFYPGETLDLEFTIHNSSTDMEWLKSTDITFPEGVTVNSSTDFIGGSGGPLATDNNTGVEATINWMSTGAWGAIHGNESAISTVNVTIDPLFEGEETIINYNIFGDLYGGSPHNVTDSLSIYNLNEMWLFVSPQNTEILFQSEQELTLNFNTSNMEPGTYQAIVHIHHNEEVTDLPVTLNIWTVSIKDNNETNINSYPNPFTNSFVLNIPKGETDIQRIEMIDATGKLIEVLWTGLSDAPEQITWNKGKSLAAGSYFVRIISESNSEMIKLIKTD